MHLADKEGKKDIMGRKITSGWKRDLVLMDGSVWGWLVEENKTKEWEGIILVS